MSYLYLIATHLADGPCAPVKVGITSHLKSRLRGVQTGSPYPIRYYEIWDMAGADGMARYFEKMFHALHAADRLTGEWFNIDPEKARQLVDLKIAVGMLASGADLELPPEGRFGVAGVRFDGFGCEAP